MRRFLIFVLLGPPLGFLVGFWGLLPLLNLAAGGAGRIEWGQLVLLPVAYWVGLLPALLAAGFDHLLAKRGTRWRPAWSAAFGFVAAFLPLTTTAWMGYIHSPWALPWGLLGAVPAAICSALSGPSSPR